jgi:CSLREA domain-containing protein
MPCHRFICAVLALCLAGGAQATTLTVTSIGDGPGTCPSATECTLREAITDANAAGGSNVIAFDIAGAGVHTIALSSQLPTITGALLIDGYTQPGSEPNTLTPEEGGLDTVLAIEIVGNGSLGFLIHPNATLTVQGLALNHFGDVINGNGGNPDDSHLYVYGNFIGTNVDGTAFDGVGNNGTAVRSNFSAVEIGGTEPWRRNLLSGNGGAGILAGGPAIIRGNLIGTDASGTLAIPNGLSTNWAGIILSARADVHIGGADPSARNVISGNHPLGIGLWFASNGPISDFEIKGNFIGTDWSGTEPVPNGFTDPAAAQYGGGIQLQSGGSSDAYPIGGSGAGEANLIAYNNGAAITAVGFANAYFDNRGNVMHHNRGVGRANVDIGNFGPTPNDADDADAGANDVPNYPEVLAASQSGDELTVTYRVDSAPANAAYPLRIDFHARANGGVGRLIAEDEYPLSAAQQERTVTLELPPGTNGIPFIVSATDANGYSSEPSEAWDVIFEDDFD